ncbi:MAG: InlB B-repeat-containing protein, partial [Clostridia bacterium]|nr:InlB B-repeat-containing protein [Clostridia bacterium]
QINAETDTSGYTFSTLPSTADAKYRLPIILFQNGSTVEIKVHRQYLSDLKQPITVSVLQGLTLKKGNLQSVTSKTVTFTLSGQSWLKDGETVDFSDKITIGELAVTGNANELKYSVIAFSDDILPTDIGYGVLDRENYKFIGDYVAVNGRTVNQINAKTDTSGYTFSTFPSTADAKYRLPIIVYQNGSTLEVKIHNDYLTFLTETSEADVTLSVLKGLSFVSGGKQYLLKTDVSATVYRYTEPTDISNGVTLSGFDPTGDAGEMRYTIASFEFGIFPAYIGYGVIDSQKYRYIGDYITVNGKTINQINAETDTSDYTFSTFPSTADAKYRLPIIVYQNGNTLEIKMHSAYLDPLIKAAQTAEDPTVKIALLQGLSFRSETQTVQLKNTITYVAYRYHKPIDISNDVSFSELMPTGDKNELKYSVITFKNGELPQDIGYGVIDSEKYRYIGDYITVNGKTVNEINASTDVKNYQFYTFPSTADAKYRVPVIVLQNGNTLEVKIHGDYVDALIRSVQNTADPTVKIGLKKGLTIENAENTFITNRALSHVVYRYYKPTVVSSGVTITGFNTTGDQNELKYTVISFKAGILPQNIGYGVLDQSAYRYIGDYITVNGKTVNEINRSTSVKNYHFYTFPSSVDAKYRVPIIVYQNGNTLEVKVHTDYIASVLRGQDVTVGIRKGLLLTSGKKSYLIDKNFSAKVYTYLKSVEKDIGNITVSKWQSFGNSGEYKSAVFTFQNGVLPSGIDYGAVDRPEYRYIFDYIYINGKSVNEINRSTSVKGYRFDSFPAIEMDYFRLPVIAFISGNTLELRMHCRYLQSFAADAVTVTFKQGLSFARKQTVYSLKKDQTFVNKKGIWQGYGDVINIADSVTAFGWTAEGETTHSVYLEFGDYPVLKDLPDDAYAFGGSLADFVTINGKTVREINQTASVKGYRWDTFPSTEIDSYKVPAILYANASSNVLQIRIHDQYLANIGDSDADHLEVGLNNEFLVERTVGNGLKYYTVSGSVVFAKVDDIWSNRNQKFKVSYFLNGKMYGEPQLYDFMERPVMQSNPQTESGYRFSGWQTEGDFDRGMITDLTVFGFVTPIRYAITYDLDGGKNDPENPIFYTVETGEIVLKDAVDGSRHFEGWYTDSKYTHKITALPKNTTGDVRLYAHFTGKASRKFDWDKALDGFWPYVGIAMLTLATTILGIFLFKPKRKQQKEAEV